LGGISAVELGNDAATFLILRASEVLEPGHGHDTAVTTAAQRWSSARCTDLPDEIPRRR